MGTLELNGIKEESNFKEFYSKISTCINSLEKFTSLKLKIAEDEGEIDKGFYKPNDLINNVILEVLKSYSIEMSEREIMKIVFLKIIKRVNEIIKKEELTDNLSVDNFLKEELNLLKEKYSVEADGDYIFEEDLDDISYKQKTYNSTRYILDEQAEIHLTGKLYLNKNNLDSFEKRNLLGWLFFSLPPISKSVTELYVFGDRTVNEIAEILLIDVEKVKRVIALVTEKLESV